MVLWRQEPPPKEGQHLLHYYHKTLQARETDHLQKSCGLSQFLFHIFSPPSVLHTLGDFKKTEWIVCGRWAVKECSACWSGFAFPKHRDVALWGEWNSHLLSQRSLSYCRQSLKVSVVFPKVEHARSFHWAALSSPPANTFLLSDLLFLCKPFRTCYPRICIWLLNSSGDWENCLCSPFSW